MTAPINPGSEVKIAGSTRQVVDVGHTKVSVQTVGSGPNLLFVHGWPLNGNTWRNVVPHLDGYTSYVMDLPGCGESKATDQTPLTVRGHADSVVRVIDALGLDEVTLVGQDSGGMVCRFAAQQRPSVVRALVLGGTEIPGVHAPLVWLFKALAKLPGAKAAFRINMANRFLTRSPLILGGTVYDKSILDGEFRTNLLDPILDDPDAMDAIVEMIKHFSADDIDALGDVHPMLTMPTLLIYGEDDKFFPAEKARLMANQFGGPTDFVTIAKCKLFLHEEHPERFAQLTHEFLSRRLSEART